LDIPVYWNVYTQYGDREMERKGYLIGEVGGESGVPRKTIRYYEEIGLLSLPVRTDSGYRLYGQETIEKLKFIKKAQGLGLTLSEIKGIIQCSKVGLKPCCNFVRQLFTKKIQVLEANIKEMQRMREELKTLLSQWIPSEKAKKGSFAVCPQIEREPRSKRKRR
ncbi:MAG: heavy metal-responsive transcriptional regulator, partial [Candidatus Brocadiaceae bacterium]|nr:heavy metal-responsive transcriptional regulator [Candidatus Brocadiaceae bacterium]